MIKRFIYVLTILFLLFFSACNRGPLADTIIHNAEIFTVNNDQLFAEAIAIKGDRIIAVGSETDVMQLKSEETNLINAQGNFVMPGFIEGHGHFSGLGFSLLNLNFMNVKSWDEIVQMVEEKVKESEPGTWIVGRGWHQEKWEESPEQNVFGYPHHHQLSEISPDNPVLLGHASGHSLFANAKAMEIAGVSVETPNPKGGAIVRDDEGNAIGVFEERAQGMIRVAYNAYLEGLSQDELNNEWYEGIRRAQEECLAKGVTSFQDAGSSFEMLDKYHELAKEGKLDLRLWVMMRQSSEKMKGNISDYRIINAGNHFYTCRAIKSEVDGALGAFGAWLLEPYNDKTDFVGQNTTEIEEVARIAEIAYDNEMQLCVHAIGDKANREVLNIMETYIQKDGNGKDLRWRIEHSQHIHPEDIPRFGNLGVIASMQGIHCTSDAPFVEKRLGFERSKYGAYPWRSLIDSGALINNGTDVPVEDVNPLHSFYASVTRKRIDSGFEFFPEQSMTRKEAIESYTLNNAIAAFEEEHKGSIEVGKLADIVILSKNLMDCSDEEILETEVLNTMVGGIIKYSQ